jgi:hypothetical protein
VSRIITARYDDPLDLIWLACVRELGMTVVRSSEVYASFDGVRTLTLCAREHFDADDSLAQMIFHELCHALVAGPKGACASDWGMENVDARDLLQEHACHRLQAALADRHGLRALFAITTEHRSYWDALPVDPLGYGSDPAIAVARQAFSRARHGTWAEPIERALTKTRELAAIARASTTDPTSLWASTAPLHPSGFPVGERGERCDNCAFSFETKTGLFCRKTRKLPERRGARIRAEDPDCVRFEPKLDVQACGECGACCREAFHRVELLRTENARRKHPALVVIDTFGAHLPRPHGRCVALAGDGDAEPYLCTIYEDRPRSCADFAIAGDACLEARRRVGLSS